MKLFSLPLFLSLCWSRAGFTLSADSQTWLRWQAQFVGNLHAFGDGERIPPYPTLLPGSVLRHSDILFATSTAAPFRLTNYVGRGMINTSQLAGPCATCLQDLSDSVLEDGWEENMVFIPSHEVGSKVKSMTARLDRFDLVHSNTAEISRAFEVATGFSVSCSAVSLGSPLGFKSHASVVLLLQDSALSCSRTDHTQLGGTRTKALNLHDTMIFLEANSSWRCQEDEFGWDRTDMFNTMLLNCAFQGHGQAVVGQPIPMTPIAPRTFAPSLFPCIHTARVNKNQARLETRCSYVGLGSGASSSSWRLAAQRTDSQNRKVVKAMAKQLEATASTIIKLLKKGGLDPFLWALDAASDYLTHRTAKSQRSGEVETNMDDPKWWAGWPTGRFPNRTFVGALASGKHKSSVPAHNTFHFMHLNNHVSPMETRFLRRGDIPAMLCMEASASSSRQFVAAPPPYQMYHHSAQQEVAGFSTRHTPLSLCLYRSDPMRFKSPIMLFTAQAMLAHPPGVAFTPTEACVLAISTHSHEKLSAFAKMSLNQQLQHCKTMEKELRALARLLVVADAIVFFDERFARDASIRGKRSW